VTSFEHAGLAGSLALAAGLHKKSGWPIILMAAAVAALPDWDGLTLMGGAAIFAEGHRTWGHNLLVAGLSGMVAGGLICLAHSSVRVRHHSKNILGGPRDTAKDCSESPQGFHASSLVVWMLVGGLASLTHLPADIICSGNSELSPWPIALLWPFSKQGFTFPILAWGDLTPTIIFVLEMFALYRWPKRAQLMALGALLVLGGYIVTRFLIFDL
jgi:hypothetical protein